MDKMCDLENSDPNYVSRPSVSPTDRRVLLPGALALTLATIPANIELAEAQAAYGVSINQTTSNGHMVGAYYAEAKKRKPNQPEKAVDEWSGQRGLNPRLRAWEARALPTELHPL